MQLSSRVNMPYFGSRLSIPANTHLKDIELQLANWRETGRLSQIVGSITVNSPEPNRAKYSLVIIPSLMPKAKEGRLDKDGIQPDVLNNVTIDNLEQQLLEKRYLKEYA
jgi:hypothetical protein